MVTALRQKRDRERKRRTRRALLDAAERVFTTDGYHSALISDIVGAAGVGQGTFYRYFEGKREIFQTLFDRFVHGLLSAFEGMTVHLPASVDEYRSASIGAIGRVAGVVEQHRDLTLLFFREGPSIDREFEQALDGVYERFAQLARFYLDHAIERGFARACNTGVVSQAIVGVGLRMLNLWLKDRLADASLTRVIEEIVDFAFMGFGVFEETAADANPGRGLRRSGESARKIE